MTMYPHKTLLAVAAVALSPLAGCGAGGSGQSAAMANPASEHCIQKGGTLEIVKEAAGEKGMCHLPDGTVVEEWELFRRDQPQG